MSINLTASLPSRRLPIPEQWQEAITRHGFELELDTEFDATNFAGYLPCKYKGVDTGFEYYYEGATSTTAHPFGPADYQIIEISFITHSESREYIAAAIAAAVLTEMTEGSLEEPQEDAHYSGKAAIEWARELESESRVELARPRATTSPIRISSSTKLWWKFW